MHSCYAFVLFDLFIKTIILTVLACIMIKVIFVILQYVYFDYTYSLGCISVLSFLTTLFGLSVQEGWTDLETSFVTTVLCLPVYSHKKTGLYCAEGMPAAWACPVKQVGTVMGEEQMEELNLEFF